MTEYEKTTRTRIRNAALTLLAQVGPKATSLRKVAEAADVSAALIIHHFGSKAGLLAAIDEYAFRETERMIERMLKRGGDDAGIQAFAKEFSLNRDLFLYFTQSLSSNNESGAATFDRLMEMTTATFAQTDTDGLTHPSPDPIMRNILMICLDLGVLLLAPHVERHLGGDLFSDKNMQRWSAAEFQMLSHGIFTDAFLTINTVPASEE